MSKYASIFTNVIDGVVKQGSVTQALEVRDSLVIYNGGKDVKIAKIATSGLADYSRKDGFTKGSATLDWETHTFTQDRGRRFDIDVMDEDETNFVESASTLLGEFTRTEIIPEIDAYRLSKIAGKAYAHGSANYSVDTVTEANALAVINGAIAKTLDLGYVAEEIICYIAYPIYNALINSEKLAKKLDVGVRTADGAVEQRFYKLNGVELAPVVSGRMKSGYVFNAGTDGGDETDGGFTAKDGAVAVNFLVVPRRGALAIVKHSISKVIPPELNQTSDGYIVALRVYHDIFFPDNASKGIIASFATAPSGDSF